MHSLWYLLHSIVSGPLLSWQTDEGFKHPAKVFGETSWRKYAKVEELVLLFGAGLRALGASPQPANVQTADHKGVLIYDDTSAEWMICAQGAMSQDIVVATAYATLDPPLVCPPHLTALGDTWQVCNPRC